MASSFSLYPTASSAAAAPDDAPLASDALGLHSSVSRFAIASILQFLEENGLDETLETLRAETQHMFEEDLDELPQGGVLLSALGTSVTLT